ncbi:unnamed protein product [Paramecium sonneborni]|uniref:Uncharacterized protein n=1 Tax=Paramecium sonneborni TaxID=65129 RepID=A0A8S1M1H0_9CILI|nr:unnamed protein product [Paramecium sonneborni]
MADSGDKVLQRNMINVFKFSSYKHGGDTNKMKMIV